MIKIEEGFSFDGRHTKEYGMSLKEREAPSPEEKEIREDVPFMHGDHDFSMFLGERIFRNRPLRYTFEVYTRNREHRKVDETVLKNWLMRVGRKNLYDDYDKGYYYKAKCTNVDIQEEVNPGRLIVTLTFDAYPFKKSELPEGHDIWDKFNFELDVSQPVEFTINNEETVTVINPGSTSAAPNIIANNNFSIEKGNTTYSISSGETESEEFRLMPGDNRMTIKGNGTIKFEWYKELM
jgi:phage-related protein